MVLTREEKEKIVLELHGQCKGTREIAKVRISFSQIGAILKKAAKQREIGREKMEKHLYQRTLTVYFAKLKANEAIEYRKEYCKLIQHDHWIHVYEELKGNVWPLVNLFRLSTAAGMTTTEVINLLKIANNDLSTVRFRFETLSKDVISL